MWLLNVSSQVQLFIAVSAIVVGLIAQAAVTRARRELANLRNDLVDERTGLLPSGAIPLRLAPELEWAHYEHHKVGIVVYRVLGTGVEQAARALRQRVRGEENAYLIGQDRFLVNLWNASEEGMDIAVQRLGAAITATGVTAVDAGRAIYPDDGTTIDELVAIAQQDMRPLEQQLPPRAAGDPPRRLLGDWRRFGHLGGPVFVNLLVAFAAIVLAHVVFPPALHIHVPPAVDVVRNLALSALLGIVTAIALVVTWNRGAGDAPASVGPWHVPLRGAAVIAVSMTALTAWSVLWPAPTRLLPYMVGATVAYGALLVLALVQGRHLARAPIFPLVVAAGAGAFLVVEGTGVHVLLANAGRLVVAVALAAIVARFVERLSWMALVAVGSALVDIWSVFSSQGVTHKLVEQQSRHHGTAHIDYLLLTGPSVEHYPIFQLGTTDLFFCALYLCFGHLWRLPMLRLAPAMVAGFAVAFVASYQTPNGIPVLPFLGFAFLTVAWRPVLDELQRQLAASRENAVARTDRARATRAAAAPASDRQPAG